MTPEDRQFLKEAFQAMADAPLEAGDPRYVDLRAVRGGEDPVELMARTIEFSQGESLQFFSGFPGTGKTTELKRLRQRLEDAGRRAVVVDAFENIGNWPPLSRSLHSHDVEQWFGKVQANFNAPDVLIIDSTEHVRGSPEVRSELEWFFSKYAAFPKIHLVYTAPPYLQARPPKSVACTLHEVGVRSMAGVMRDDGTCALAQLVAQRTDIARLMGDSALERLVLASGGSVAELLLLVRELIRRADSLPVRDTAIDAAIEHVRAEFPTLTAEDAPSLAKIARSHRIMVDVSTSTYDLWRWANAHFLLSYRNGSVWYDVHPLIRDTVLQRADEMTGNSGTQGHDPEPAPVSPKHPRPSVHDPAVSLTPEMRVTLVVDNYRALRHVQWTLPRGVSALVGPNGSGKSTLLDIPGLLRHALAYDMRKAIDDRGGPGTLRNLRADRNAPVILGIRIDDLAWQLDLSPKGAAFNLIQGEHVTMGGTVVLDRTTANARPDDARPFLGRSASLAEGAELRPLVALLEGYRLYGTYDLAGIRFNGSQVSSDDYLHPDGRNVFSVLRNWRDRKETRPRWDFVLASLKEAFPDTFDDLDFEMAGQTVVGRIVGPRPDDRLSTFFAANGWLVALLHLAAVASTPPAGAVAIDEVENGLHPFAIRALVDAMRRWAGTAGISVVIATHSPVVIDQFKDEPDHLFVMEPGRETQPARLDELHDPAWLAHFSLGDLYAHDEFGAPHKDEDDRPAV